MLDVNSLQKRFGYCDRVADLDAPALNYVVNRHAAASRLRVDDAERTVNRS